MITCSVFLSLSLFLPVLSLIISYSVGCSEHLIPYWMNNPWRKLYGPGFGRDVNDFIGRLREKQIDRHRRHMLNEATYVRQLLRRFPDMDLEYLQERYPRVPVQYLKNNLHQYRERHFISPGTLPENRR